MASWTNRWVACPGFRLLPFQVRGFEDLILQSSFCSSQDLVELKASRWADRSLRGRGGEIKLVECFFAARGLRGFASKRNIVVNKIWVCQLRYVQPNRFGRGGSLQDAQRIKRLPSGQQWF